MYGCESWTVKKAECQRIGAFELWCWRRLLRVPWTARRSNQSILKEISPGISLEGMMLKLKLHMKATSCEELTHWKRHAGRYWGQEEKGMTEDEMAGWHHWLDGRESEWTPGVGDGQAWRAAIHGVAKSRTGLSDWSDMIWATREAHNSLLFRENRQEPLLDAGDSNVIEAWSLPARSLLMEEEWQIHYQLQ